MLSFYSPVSVKEGSEQARVPHPLKSAVRRENGLAKQHLSKIKQPKEVTMKRFSSLLAMALLLVFTGGATAQVTEEWVRTYNGPGNKMDRAKGVGLDGAGNVYVAGTSYGSGTKEDFAAIKYNPDGVQQWVSRYNRPGNYNENSAAMAVDASGNVYITGSTGWSYYDGLTVKYDSAGVLRWAVTYIGPGGKTDRFYDIAVDDSGNVYVTGFAYIASGNSDYVTIKYNSAGSQQWAATYNGYGSGNDAAYAIAVDDSGNVYVTGYAYGGSASSSNYATIKYNSAGVRQWVAHYDGPENDRDHAYALAIDASGNAYVTGTSRRVKGDSQTDDMATVKYNSAGEQQWVARYNSPSDLRDGAQAIAVDESGNAYVTGWSWISYTDANCVYATIKYDSEGVDQWVANYDGPIGKYDVPYDIALDARGGVYVIGQSDATSTTDADYATVKYDSTGTQKWVMRHGGAAGYDDVAYRLAIDSRRNVYVTGWTRESGSSNSSDYEDLTTIKYSQILTDIDIVSIDSPADTVLSARTYTPQATVTNHEGDPVDFPVICEFDSSGVLVYCDTVEVVGLGGGDTTQVSFTDWTSGYADGITYTMTVFAAAEDDGEPENDAISKTVTAVWPPRDVAPVAIITPPDFVWAGCPHIPRATIANFWEDPETFDVRCEFDSAGVMIYSDVVSVTSLAGGQSIEVEFAPWSAGAVDEFDYLMTVTTLHPKDLNPANDTISKIVAARKAVPDLDIQDYAGNLSANTMELTGVPNSIVVGSYVLVNPDDWEKNIDLFDGPGNVDLDLTYSCTDLSTYGGAWMIGAANIDPDLNEVSSLGLGTGAQNILQVYIPSKAHFETYVGKVVAIGAAEDGSTDADEFTLKVNVVADKGGGKPTSFGGEPLAQGNHLYWTNFGFGEQGFNLYRAEPGSESFLKLNESIMKFTSYTDYDVAAGADYQYKLGLAMADESEVLLGPLSLTSSEEVGLPVLEQNWPNPWADATEICYFLPKGVSSATLKVYDVSGKLVKTLASGPQDAGAHSVIWDGRDEQGQSVASGVYFYMLNTGDQKQTKKMLLLR